MSNAGSDRFMTMPAERLIRWRGAFTLIEVMTALTILAMVCSSVWVVIDRCMAAAADSTLRTAAFEAVRENMEKILSSASVKESVEYGTCDRYPDISWETVVESFDEPITGKMWVRAVCTAEYIDAAGETQTIELTHWLTELTEEQAAQLMKDKELQESELADQILATAEQAAEYAGVDTETIEQWVEDGLVQAEDSSFIKHNIDLFVGADGKPSAEDKSKQVKSLAELMGQAGQTTATNGQRGSGQQQGGSDVDPVTGLTYEQLDQMSVEQITELLMKRNQK